jgi:hypothetical protein
LTHHLDFLFSKQSNVYEATAEMIVFDVEASGLSTESYPIKIAWQDSENPNTFT